MRKKIQIASLVFVGIAAAVVCSVSFEGTLKPLPDTHTRAVIDMTGREVSIPAQPSRILSLCGSATDTVIRLNAAQMLAAVDQYGAAVPGAENIATVGKESSLSREKIVSLNIDLAFVWWYQDDAAAMLEKLSIPVVRITNVRAYEVSGLLAFVGDCVNRKDEAAILASSLNDKLDALPVQEQRTKVYFELYSPFKTIGGGCYIDDLLSMAGLENIAAKANGRVIISAEKLVECEPDIILYVEGFGSAQSIMNRSGFKNLKAVRDGNIYAINRSMLIAGGGLYDAVENLKKIIPEGMKIADGDTGE